MFKSVFAKYLSVFMLILIFSIAMLTAITITIVGSYAAEAKIDIITNTATLAVEYLENDIEKAGSDDLSNYISDSSNDIGDVMRAFASNSEDLTVLIVNDSGKILFFADKDRFDPEISVTLPEDLLSEFSNNEAAPMESVDGLFDSSQMAISLPIESGEGGTAIGRLFVCASSFMFDGMLEVMVKTVFMSSLWVMLAAMIAVYFMTERIITPLREMSRAAKSFSEGDFSVRVPVRGRDEVAQLAQAFNNMAETLEESESTRNSFMANIAHDLRTPMTTISGFIDGILDGAIPQQKHEYYLGVIGTEVKRLSRLVSQLLDISRMQAGDRKFNMQPFDICEMGRQILFSFENKINAKRLEVEFDFQFDNMYVNADRDSIYQILYNLCDNAVKFSREGGLLKLSARETQEANKVFVEVYNEGQGIPEEDLKHVFERFYKSDKSRGLDKTGVGLGLYIAKTIIDAHREKIWVDSQYGKYCKFGFTLEVLERKTHNGRKQESE